MEKGRNIPLVSSAVINVDMNVDLINKCVAAVRFGPHTGCLLRGFLLKRDADKSEQEAGEMGPICSQDSKNGGRESLNPEGQAKPPAVGECWKPAGSRAVVPEGSRHQQRRRCSQLLLWLVPWFGAVVVGWGYLRREEDPPGALQASI